MLEHSMRGWAEPGRDPPVGCLLDSMAWWSWHGMAHLYSQTAGDGVNGVRLRRILVLASFTALQVMDRKDAVPQHRCLTLWLGRSGAGSWDSEWSRRSIESVECGTWRGARGLAPTGWFCSSAPRQPRDLLLLVITHATNCR